MQNWIHQKPLEQQRDAFVGPPSHSSDEYSSDSSEDSGIEECIPESNPSNISPISSESPQISSSVLVKTNDTTILSASHVPTSSYPSSSSTTLTSITSTIPSNLSIPSFDPSSPTSPIVVSRTSSSPTSKHAVTVSSSSTKSSSPSLSSSVLSSRDHQHSSAYRHTVVPKFASLSSALFFLPFLSSLSLSTSFLSLIVWFGFLVILYRIFSFLFPSLSSIHLFISSLVFLVVLFKTLRRNDPSNRNQLASPAKRVTTSPRSSFPILQQTANQLLQGILDSVIPFPYVSLFYFGWNSVCISLVFSLSPSQAFLFSPNSLSFLASSLPFIATVLWICFQKEDFHHDNP